MILVTTKYHYPSLHLSSSSQSLLHRNNNISFRFPTNYFPSSFILQEMGKIEPKKYYAVHQGRNPGIYTTWNECQREVSGYKGAVFKGFPTKDEAQQYVRYGNNSSSGVTNGDIRQKEYSSYHNNSSLYNRSERDWDDLLCNRSARYHDSPSSYDNVNEQDCDDSSHYKSTERHVSSSHKNNWLTVYTDGSALGNGQFGAKAGIGAFFGCDDPRNISKPLRLIHRDDKPTNQKAEIQAVYETLKVVNKHQDVVIKTDSQYVINAMTDWIHNWRKKGFEGVANKAYFLELDNQLKNRSGCTRFEYVPGHSGNSKNEEADKLARLGAAMF